MEITFFGAAHGVTGSCHLVDTGKQRILFDCGMFQGSNFNEGKNNDDFPFDPKSIDILLVSHAHIDHTGRVPKLVRDGFTGKIYMTKATQEFAKLIWDDAHHIMTYDNKKFGSPILYNEVDITDTLHKITGVDYRETVELAEGVTAVFKDAGHIFGSAFIELTVNGKTIAFSGDIGNNNVPILRETDQLGNIDILLCETTYGDRVHENERTRKEMLLDVITQGVKRGGAIMMPSFSLERTQEIVYLLDELFVKDKTLPDIPIYVDSPLAIRAFPVYKKYTEYYDTQACEKFMKGNDFLDFERLTLTMTREESMKINHVPNPKLIIAGAGMMNGGRILHHAKRYLSDPNATLIIVGYQAKNTLGRKLYEGAEMVMIHKEKIHVKAKILAIGALSAHGDQKKLLSWIRNAEKQPEKVYCVHGDPHASTTFAHKLRDDMGLKAFVPEEGEMVEI
jgi:metallo-beta-lactamase family protein